jgi:hypothetical protein
MTKTPATVKFGRKAFPFSSFEEVSCMFCEYRDAKNFGASSRYNEITLWAADGSYWGHVSYNGNVWDCAAKDWVSGKKPVYSPYVNA